MSGGAGYVISSGAFQALVDNFISYKLDQDSPQYETLLDRRSQFMALEVAEDAAVGAIMAALQAE